MEPRSIEAVVFDFDGVLARSIELHAVAYQLVLHPFGVPVSPHDIFLREGARSETIIEELMQAAGLEPDAGQVQRLSHLKQRVFERIGTPATFPWARQVVEEVGERGFPMAIATGTRRENVPAIAAAFVDRFAFLSTQESYEHDKPHPEPFLTAAEGLGVDPERCLAIENAPRGIASAKDAGMFVVALTTTLTADDVGEAHLVLETLPEVLDVLPQRPGGRVEL